MYEEHAQVGLNVRLAAKPNAQAMTGKAPTGLHSPPRLN